MPKLNGRSLRVLKGEKNPRHFIMIPVGTGNQFCRNCKHLTASAEYCTVFPDHLKVHPRFGAERCVTCREAEHLIQKTKEAAQKEGANGAFFRENSMPDRKSGLLNMPTV